MGGLETVKKIKKFDKNVKVIVASGHLSETMLDELNSEGFNEFLPKPFKMDELEAIINKLLNS